MVYYELTFIYMLMVLTSNVLVYRIKLKKIDKNI